MPGFKYLARRKSGEIARGMIEASSIEDASSLLKDKELIVVELKERTWHFTLGRLMSYMNQVRNKDVVFFARQMSVMLEANVPVVKSLRILVKQTANPQFKLVVADLASEVDGGAKFSQALTRYPKIFSNLFIYMIKAGETTGRLDKVLLYLAEQLEKDYALKKRMKGAMTYPAFIFAVLLTMGTLMMIFVVPKFIDIFETGNIELPWTTKLLLQFSAFITGYWWIIVILVVVTIAAVYAFNRTESGHYYIHLFKIKAPIIGPLTWKNNMVRFSRTLSSLIVSGVPVTKSLEIVGEVVDNEVYKRAIFRAARGVEVGETISSIFARDKNMPIMVTNMINVGEETGRLDKVLEKVADFYETETDIAVKSLVSLLEPIILVIIGVATAGLVVSILMPMYKLTDSIT